VPCESQRVTPGRGRDTGKKGTLGVVDSSLIVFRGLLDRLLRLVLLTLLIVFLQECK